jgi:hypothetical protein
MLRDSGFRRASGMIASGDTQLDPVRPFPAEACCVRYADVALQEITNGRVDSFRGWLH